MIIELELSLPVSANGNMTRLKPGSVYGTRCQLTFTIVEWSVLFIWTFGENQTGLHFMGEPQETKTPMDE
jgi:5-keto 4-deoxyuronate isomerase